MGYGVLFLAVVAACLLWSAAFTAAAARSSPGLIRWLLLALAVAMPPLALTPCVWFSCGLAALGLQTNWFVPMLTACLSSLAGGACIACAGLGPRAAPAAAAWPPVGLAALFLLATATAAGAMLSIDIAVAAEGRMLRGEAARIMATALPPAPSADDNSASLYGRSFAALAADTRLREPESPASKPLAADVTTPVVAALLERHAAALDMLRLATDRPGCRFDRDWSQPSFDMPLPEVQEMRQAARLLALATRRAAADGHGARALADVVRIHRLGMHAASEPILVSGLVGQSIDALAINTLADVLPHLDKDDLPLLDGESVRDFVATPVRYERAFLGEEAVGLATLADLSDGRRELRSVELLQSVATAGNIHAFGAPASLLYRCFLLPADVAGYRAVIHRYQALIAAPASKPFAELEREAATIEEDLKKRQAGIFSALMAPALASVVAAQSRGAAIHGAAGVLVAATRARLMGTSLADSFLPDAVPPLPRDPFTADAPLLAKRTDDAWVVYSVGPDGEDDGGPVPAEAEPVSGNDDVGLRLAF